MKLLENEKIATEGIFETNEAHKVRVDNHQEVYRIYKIKLDNLYYNDQNDRIATWISQYKADNNVSELSMDDVEEYNKIIESFIVKSNEKSIQKTKNSIAAVQQQRPGIVLNDGRIIDGNRRFTCLRQIQRESGMTQYFDAVILPYNYENDKKKIKMLELEVQLGTEEKVDYDPIDKLVGIYTNIVETQLLTEQDYANMVCCSVKEVKKEVEKAKLMVEFLDFIRAPKKYHIAREMKLGEPLKELLIAMSKCKDDEEKDTLRDIMFMNFATGASRNSANGELGQKAYVRHIKAIADNDVCRRGYIQEQDEILDVFCDKVDLLYKENGHISETEISALSGETEIVDALTRASEKWTARANSEANKNAPAKLLDKAITVVASIDSNIFVKLTDEQLDTVQKKIDELQAAIDEIKGELDA